ncbi:hypothetical protein SUGI_0071190 [Cryptomeria japonica]|nr:hypothetical protein SUGI_0071190 [Cryptomeria japonica]
MKNLRRLELKANKGLAIQSCIQTIQKWPEEILIAMPTVPEASSLLDSFEFGVSPNLCVVDSISNQKSKLVVQNHSSDANAIMLCFVISHARGQPISLRFRVNGAFNTIFSLDFGEGRWAVIGVFTQHSKWLTANGTFCIEFYKAGSEVERGLGVRGEEERLVMEALLPLLQTISS